MAKNKTYWKHRSLGFVIGVTKEAKLEMVDEDGSSVNTLTVDENEAICLHGVVVYDTKETWGEGYISNFWAKQAFNLCSNFVCEIEKDTKSWTAKDLNTGIEYFGGYLTLGSYENRDYRVEYEWDSNRPEFYEDIEAELNDLI